MTKVGEPSPKATENVANVAELSEAARGEIAQLVRRAAAEHKAGKTAAVEKTLEAILEIDPQHAESLFNLAILARDKKEISQSERMFRRAIAADPLRIDAYHGLGELLYNARHLMLAIATFEKGLEVAPTQVQLMANLARCYLQLQKPKPVAELCRKILEIYPDDADALWLLGWAEYVLGEPRSALATLDHLGRVSPENVRGWVVRYLSLEAIGEAEAAAAQLAELTEKALTDWIYVKGVVEVYAWCGRTDRSYELVRKFIERHPDSSNAFRELSALQMNDGLFREVQQNLDEVLRLQPDSLYVQMVSALSAFRMRDYPGFYRYHDSRWGRDTHEGKWDLPVPPWRGQKLTDKALLIYSEQGIGDHVMYAGFFPSLRKFAKRITIDTSVRLFGLFQRSFPDMGLADRNQLPADWPSSDFGGIAPYGDLPELLDVDFEHLPDRDGYLVADPALSQKLRRKYQEMFPGKRLVGISWRSGNRDSAVTRSVDLPHWRPILETPGYAFISVQYGSIERDLTEMKDDLGIDIYRDAEIDPMSLMDPFAAQLAAMDLVISADNSTVHFAGALGIPCWLMLPVNSDWRWQLERDDSVWYSSLTLFRARRDQGGDWGAVIAAIAGTLAALDESDLRASRTKRLLRSMDTMRRHERVSEAEDFARQLIELGEHTGAAMHTIGIAALRTGVTGDAVEILSQAARLLPGDTAVLGDLIIALDANGQGQQAERLGRDALRQAAEDNYLLNAMGQLLTRQQRHDEASDYFARILRHRPEDIEARQALARLQMLQGEPELAQQNLERALGYDSNARSVHAELAEIMLRQSEPAPVAWEHFRWRFPERPGELPRHLAMVDPNLQPDVWAGGKLRRQRLMLRAERTVLEQVMFMCRFTELTGTARPVLMEIDPRLMPMLRTDARRMDVRAAGTTEPAAIVADRIRLVASLGDLAALAMPDLAPGKASPSLTPDPEQIARYRAAFQAALPGRKLVGLSWRERGAPAGLVLLLAQIVPFLLRRDIGVVLLQSDLAPDERAALSEIAGCALPALSVVPGALDFPDFAAQLAALDVVVSAEELTAHLAAATGIKTVKLCGALSHWAWGDRSGPCLWYPDARSVRVVTAEDAAALPELIGL